VSLVYYVASAVDVGMRVSRPGCSIRVQLQFGSRLDGRRWVVVVVYQSWPWTSAGLPCSRQAYTGLQINLRSTATFSGSCHSLALRATI
jgi:hypothetical protein